MRYLSKVVFINSAHVPYAEIKLDGNVHFVGTQGVGKSTLLRAILFFYNADKAHLGISKEQKSFDEFYLPNKDSYVIYEITREQGKFFVLTFLRMGRAAFRIVDCAYDKSFFIKEDGSVYYDWGSISQNIGTRNFKSNIIQTYEKFRDIIYGNAQKVDRELRRFSLMESSRYENVPRTIQNIFLNQSLESRVIKDTIIDSMDFSDDNINLTFYRDHIKDFRQQYEDIWKWYRKDRNGNVKVRNEADDVVSKYTLYNRICQEIHDHYGYLNYAYTRDLNEIPVLESSIGKSRESVERQQRLISEESGKFDKEKVKLAGDEAVVKDKLDKTEQRRRHYSEINIQHILQEAEKKPEYEISLARLVEQEQAITGQHVTIKEKYDKLRLNAEVTSKELLLDISKRIQDAEGVKNQELAHINDDLSNARERYDQIYEEKSNDLSEQRETYQKQKAASDTELYKIDHDNPFEKQMQELECLCQQFSERSQTLKYDIQVNENKIADLQHQFMNKEKDLQSECERRCLQKELEIKDISRKITEIEEILSRQKGSFMEWLGVNVPGWEETIGKIADESSVLYNRNLSPKLLEKDVSDTFYGIGLDMDEIDSNFRTPRQLQEEKAELESALQIAQSEIAALRNELEQAVENLRKKFSSEISKLKIVNKNLNAELIQLPVKIDARKKELEELKIKLSDHRQKAKDKVYERRFKIEQELENIVQQKKKLDEQRKKDRAAVEKMADAKKSHAQAQFDQKRSDLEARQNQIRTNLKLQLQQIDSEMDEELKGHNVDTAKLDSIRKKKHRIDQALSFIELHVKDVYAYENDQEEYFSKEDAMKDERKRLRKKLDDLIQKYRERKGRLNVELERLMEECDSFVKRLDSLKEQVEDVDKFRLSNESPVQEADPVETSRSLRDILNDLRNLILAKQQKMDSFKRSVNTFKNNFSEQNTFHFRTEFSMEEDYLNFAEELHIFLINNKIEDYSKRTSHQYADILLQISKEVGDLLDHKSDIESTINEINKDFGTSNFTGVIKDIALRSVESNDPLMQHLLNIKKFKDENEFNMGEADLFSDEKEVEKTNQQVVNLLMSLMDRLELESKRDKLTLADTFKLEFKVKENDNDTNWVEKLSNVGSDGTDILVKAMVNIMLINVFKRKVSRKFGDFKLHCMMDEIGKLHPNNVAGILDFANKRNIYLINSSPTTYNASAYRYTYSLSKDNMSNTVVKSLLTIN